MGRCTNWLCAAGTSLFRDGKLDMRLLLEKFAVHFDDVYGDRDERFVEEDGRRYFMLYLKPIINGVRETTM